MQLKRARMACAVSILLTGLAASQWSGPARAGAYLLEGEMYSSVDEENEFANVSFEYANVGTTRVTGKVTVRRFGEPNLVYTGTGTRNRRGSFTFKGRAQRTGISLNLTAKGQQSVTGSQMIGTYTVTGRVDGQAVSDIGGFFLTDR